MSYETINLLGLQHLKEKDFIRNANKVLSGAKFRPVNKIAMQPKIRNAFINVNSENPSNPKLNERNENIRKLFKKYRNLGIMAKSAHVKLALKFNLSVLRIKDILKGK